MSKRLSMWRRNLASGRLQMRSEVLLRGRGTSPSLPPAERRKRPKPNRVSMEKPRCCPAANNGAPTRENAPVRALAPTTQSGPSRVRGGSLDGMAKLEGAAFWMGTGGPNVYAADGEGPARLVTLTGFYISRHAVDNAHAGANRENSAGSGGIARFCRESGYRTDAERLGWSFVLQGSLSDGNAGDPLPGAP